MRFAVSRPSRHVEIPARGIERAVEDPEIGVAAAGGLQASPGRARPLMLRSMCATASPGRSVLASATPTVLHAWETTAAASRRAFGSTPSSARAPRSARARARPTRSRAGCRRSGTRAAPSPGRGAPIRRRRRRLPAARGRPRSTRAPGPARRRPSAGRPASGRGAPARAGRRSPRNVRAPPRSARPLPIGARASPGGRPDAPVRDIAPRARPIPGGCGERVRSCEGHPRWRRRRWPDPPPRAGNARPVGGRRRG